MSIEQPEAAIAPHVRHDWPIAALLFACVLENPILALVNNYLFAVNASTVASVQMAITAAAVVLLLLRRPQMGWHFAAAAGIFYFFVLIKIALTGAADYRFVYDVSLIPLFLLLGSTAHRFEPWIPITIVIAMLAGTIFELTAFETYSDVLNPQKYFYFTRNWVAAAQAPTASIYESSGIYFGAFRESGNFFGIDHRAGSFFLEPISLGYFSVIASILILYSRHVQRKYKVLLCTACVFMAIASDTRVAVFLILAFALFRDALARIPRPVVFASPFILLLLLALAYAVSAKSGGDISLRLAVTMATLYDNSLWHVIVGGIKNAKFDDSGILYLIGNAGIFGYCTYPLLASGIALKSRRSTAVATALLLYLYMGLTFGCAPLSIKTASILGYGGGALGKMKNEDADLPR